MSSSQKPNILIVDDDELVVEAIHGYIAKRYDANIEIAATGQDAIDRTSAKDYDILLLDVKMPAMDGISALYEIRRNNESIHTIMITSWHSAEVLNEAMAAGANAFLVKPVQPNLLKVRLDSALKNINKLRPLR